jgi:hypothetical protein
MALLMLIFLGLMSWAAVVSDAIRVECSDELITADDGVTVLTADDGVTALTTGGQECRIDASGAFVRFTTP